MMEGGREVCRLLVQLLLVDLNHLQRGVRLGVGVACVATWPW